MQTTIQNDEFITSVNGAEVLIYTTMKIEVEYDYRSDFVEVERVHILGDDGKWSRIDDCPDCKILCDAAEAWAKSRNVHLCEQAIEGELVSCMDPNAEHRLTKSQLVKQEAA